MALTKTLRTLIAAATSAAAGSTRGSPGASGTLNMTACYGGVWTAKITNGGTGPTVGASVEVQYSGDNTNWKQRSLQGAGTTLSTDYEFSDEIPLGTMYVKILVYGNTGQNVTCEAFVQEVTTV